jgi:hypothetical protein
MGFGKGAVEEPSPHRLTWFLAIPKSRVFCHFESRPLVCRPDFSCLVLRCPVANPVAI